MRGTRPIAVSRDVTCRSVPDSQNFSRGGSDITLITWVDQEDDGHANDKFNCDGDDSADNSTVDSPIADTEISDTESVDNDSSDDTHVDNVGGSYHDAIFQLSAFDGATNPFGGEVSSHPQPRLDFAVNSYSVIADEPNPHVVAGPSPRRIEFLSRINFEPPLRPLKAARTTARRFSNKTPRPDDDDSTQYVVGL